MEGDPRFRQQFARDFRAVEEDPSDADASAIPNLQVSDTELNALQSRFLDGTPNPERMTDLEYMPRSANSPPDAAAFHSQNPIDEFNRSQPLLTLAFPTLYPDGKADFVEPRLRSITYQDYLGHAMRWHDGRFARHKTWPFVALNTLLQEAMAEPDEPEAQDLIQSITRQAAVIRGTRPPGLFVTAKWKAAPEAARMVLSRQLLRDNAHIAAYHFHKRYTLFRTIVLKQKFNLTDFGAVTIREQFTRIWGYHVSAVNPEPQRIQAPGKGIPDRQSIGAALTVQFLSMVVNRVQRHRCNNYCMQLNKHTKQVECRFGFPHGQRLLASLDKVPHSKHWNFRGERNDGQINHYNRLLTVAWLANTDVSPCTSLQQVIDYAAKYCSKSEKKSESFAQIGKALMPRVKDHNPLISFTSKLLNQLVAERDYSKQEAFPLLRIDGDEVDEAPNVYEKYTQRPEALADLSYVSFLKCWNIRPRDPSKWKQWQPVNVNGRPRVTTVMVMTITVGQKRLDYIPKMINMRLCLWRKNLMTKTGFASPPFYLGTPLPRKILTFLAAVISMSITTGHGIHPMANDVEVLGPHWRNTLNPQQRLVYDTFMGHFQAKNPTQILLHVDGGGGTGKSFLIKAFPQRSLEFFGGVSVLLVGDFFQLPPVRQKPLYSTSTSLSSLERRGHVAYRLFDRTVFLTTVQRQAGDDQAQFRQALQELREVKLSIPSWNLLSSRVQARLTQSEVDSFRAALRVYSTRARVNEYNYEHMVHLNAPAVQVEAKNQGKGAGQAPSDNAGNLSNKFPVAKGARGTVYDIAWNAGAEPLEDPPAVIMVDFDSYDGPPYLTTNEGRKISPILPSLTKDQIVTDLATRDFQAGISYVAVSRVTSLQGLLLEAPFDRQSLYNHTPTEGMKMRLADQQRRQGQQLSDAPYPPLYLD
ncbi:ATP-dependent DNA helicase PIF1 [Hirsutella rhossiliensis]|uniref:ATP-dependent DNA helicase PIF1 n=1 Tax=Hirsutella rhossiliensis TaxID=111463 RepID=A0A9P8N3K5_9HYPO|nr:ATP-dependent DNA helicase PIF1 [Hirsutella rhossiliensis]KAH0966189.1 ATP-dependent DNA helicase PIF1 [Hirsutella rhossiliensis]